MGLFDSLSKNGIKNVSTSGMYAKTDTTIQMSRNEKFKDMYQDTPQFDEDSMILLKKYSCPVCDSDFQSPTVKTGKIRQVGIEKNLKPIFDFRFEPIKYEPITCPKCGYSVMARFLTPLTSFQRKMFIESEDYSFVAPGGLNNKVVSYSLAVTKIKMSLVTAIIRKAKASEKAYICLKGYWLCESYLEALDRGEDDGSGKNPDEVRPEIQADMEEFSQSAYDGFIEARQSERYPIAGMDEPTLDFLIAEMSVEREKYDVASKLIASILGSNSASSRIKDKTRILKEEVLEAIRNKKNSQ